MGAAKIELPPIHMRLRGIVIHAQVPAKCECGGGLEVVEGAQNPDIPLPHKIYACVDCGAWQYVKPEV